MKFVSLLKAKSENIKNAKIPTVAFLGDSVTQGCFEIYMKTETALETVFDQQHAYHKYFANILATLYPNVPVNIINAGISGDSACGGAARLERDVLSHFPDLTVVCLGLNDCGGGMDGIARYSAALDDIFSRLNAAGSEIIFMTPNMMNTTLSPHLTLPMFKDIAISCAERQNGGVLRAYLDEAKRVAHKHGARVCDVYAKWEKLYACGVDTTELLSNRINHPTREMNYLFAYSLVETIFDIDKSAQ